MTRRSETGTPDDPAPQTAQCPVTYALGLFGDRWTLVVLTDVLFEGRRRFRDLLAGRDGLATNILSDRLKRLEAYRFLTKQRDPADARQHVYSATETAIGVIPMIVEMALWSVAQSGAPPTGALAPRDGEDRAAMIERLTGLAREQLPTSAAPD